MSEREQQARELAAWQAEELKKRHREADEGKFASAAEVAAVIRKFVPGDRARAAPI